MATKQPEPIKHPDNQIFSSGLKPKMFMHWNVPGRFTGDEKKPAEVEIINSKPATAEKKPVSPPKSPPKSCGTKIKSPAVQERKHSRNVIPMPKISTPHPQTPAKTPQKPASAPKPAPPLGRKKVPTLEDEKIELIRSVVHPSMQENAIKMLKNSSSSERRVIERALVAAYLGEKEKPLSKSLKPDAKKNVEKWLKNASAEEREIAFEFFGSLQGRSFESNDERKEKLQEIIETLESEDPTSKNRLNPKESDLKYIRLLTPFTRGRRDMLQTWHHMPNYGGDTKTECVRSSHFYFPHRYQPVDYQIHPNWGI